MKAMVPAVRPFRFGALSLLLAASSFAGGLDGAGVSADTLSLPKGPGSMEGFGASFQPNLTTGGGAYSVAFEVPKAASSFGPSLSLGYNAGSGNGPFGVGWDLGLTKIQRQTEHGIPIYGASDVLLAPNGEELVVQPDGSRRERVESSYSRYGALGVDGIVVHKKAGGVQRFGKTDQARVVGPSGVFAWYLEEDEDPHGNVIRYHYRRDGGRLYLDEIHWGQTRPGGPEHVVKVDYESRTDVLTDAKGGFLTMTALRASELKVLSSGSVVRRYRFAYHPSRTTSATVRNPDGSQYSIATPSLLASVTRTDGTGTVAFPIVEKFSYTSFAPGSLLARDVVGAPPRPVGNETELVDLDGDGLADILHTVPGEHRWQRNLGGGRFGAETTFSTRVSAILSGNTQLADMDGDGRTDFVVDPGSGAGAVYYPSRGTDGWGVGVPMALASGGVPGGGFTNPNVRFVDLDFDRQSDVFMTSPAGFLFWKNGGPQGFVAKPTLPLVDAAAVFASNGAPNANVQLVDFNGDRMRDLAVVRPGGVRWYPGLGGGRFGSAQDMMGVPDLAPSAGLLRFNDIDGDGLEDCVVIGSSFVDVRMNVSGKAFDAPYRITGTPSLEGNVAARITDVDGNGTADFLWTTPQGWKWLPLTVGAGANLLRQIDNGVGRLVTMSWRPSSDEAFEAEKRQRTWGVNAEWVTKSPSVVPLLSELRVSDLRTRVENITQYHYSDPYYDPEERQFRGFARVWERAVGGASTPTLITESRFDVGKGERALKGKLVWVEKRPESGSSAFEQSATTFAVRDAATGTRIAEPMREERTEIELGVGAPRTSAVEHVYDRFGNETVKRELGDAAVSGDETVTRRMFILDEVQWNLVRPQQESVEDGAGRVVAAKFFYYDGPEFQGLPLGQLTRGDLTRTRACEGPAFEEASCRIDASRSKFDAWGNVVAKLDAERGRREYAYDSEFQAYPVRETVFVSAAKSVSATMTWDTKIGKPLTYTDFNGSTTKLRYDLHGRMDARFEPGDDDTHPSQLYAYGYGATANRLTTMTRQSTNGGLLAVSVSCVDGLGRVFQTLTEVDGRGKFLAAGAVEHDERGQVRKAWEPYYRAGDDCLAAAPSGAGLATTKYDAMGRPLEVTQADGTKKRFAYAVGESTGFDELDKPTRSLTDGRGRLKAVERKLGAAAVTERLTYEARGLRSSIADALGATTTWTYDGLGRVTTIQHPDAGTVRNEYDRAGRLVLTTDARGRKVRVGYDVAGRAVSKVFENDPDSANGDPVELHYDDPAPGRPSLRGQAGKLSWTKDATGERYLSYDARGRVEAEVRVVDGREFVFRTAYDNVGRETERVLADGESIKRTYDLRGELLTVDGWLDGRDVEAHGVATREAWANGAKLTATVDVLGRVTRIQVSGSRGDKVEDLAFARDAVGNVLSVDDASAPLDLELASLVRRWDYSYDDLHRLVKAKTDRGAGELRYSYDLAGVMQEIAVSGSEQASKAHRFTYGGAQPHVPTQVDGAPIRANEAGQWVEARGKRYAWNADGMMVRASSADGAELGQYRYDYGGNRVVKQAGGKKTLYVAPDYEVRDERVTKYVFVGPRRAVRRDGMPRLESIADVAPAQTVGGRPIAHADGAVTAGDAAVLLRIGAGEVAPADGSTLSAAAAELRARLVLKRLVGVDFVAAGEERVRYLHPDLLGGLAAETDEKGHAVAINRFDPYGAPRADIGRSEEPYGYTGKERDAESTLTYFGARYLDAELGVWTSVDPNAFRFDLNHQSDTLRPYQAQNLGPIGHSDPDGRRALKEGENRSVVAISSSQRDLNSKATQYGPVDGFDVSGEKCGQGTRQTIGAMTTNDYFRNGIGHGGDAHSLAMGSSNPYLQKSGLYAEKVALPKGYLDDRSQWKVGDVVAARGGKSGHVQVWTGESWVSDFNQGDKILKEGGKDKHQYSDFALHRMKDPGRSEQSAETAKVPAESGPNAMDSGGGIAGWLTNAMGALMSGH